MNEKRFEVYGESDENLDNTKDVTLEGEVYRVVDLEFPTLGFIICNVCIIDMTYWKDRAAYYENKETRSIMCENDYNMVVQMYLAECEDDDDDDTLFEYYVLKINEQTRKLILDSVYRYGRTTFELANDLITMDGECDRPSIRLYSNIFENIRTELANEDLERVTPSQLQSYDGPFFIDATEFYDGEYPNSIGQDIMREAIHHMPSGKIAISIIFEGKFSGLFSVFCDPRFSGSPEITAPLLDNDMHMSFRVDIVYLDFISHHVNEVIALYAKFKCCSMSEAKDAIIKAMTEFDLDVYKIINHMLGWPIDKIEPKGEEE